MADGKPPDPSGQSFTCKDSDKNRAAHILRTTAQVPCSAHGFSSCLAETASINKPVIVVSHSARIKRLDSAG
jgi:hypothetical protein